MPINRSILLASLLLLSSLSWAQDNTAKTTGNIIEPQRWFEIEVILFSQPSSQATEKEYWPTDISLAYPPNWVALQDPATLQKDDTTNTGTPSTEVDGEGELNSYAPPKKDLNKDPLDIRVAEPTSEIDLTQAAFYLLPEELRQLNEKARHLSRSHKHRVLFHQAWRQPVLDSDEAPALLISAGDQYGAHSELEGTIKFSVARYLHLRTNLWFSEFSHNYGQERGLWPELPTRPDLRDYQQGQLQPKTLEHTLNAKPSNFTQFDLSTEGKPWAPPAAQGSIASNLLHDYQAPRNEFDNIIDHPYLPQRIALIKQKRRMRSKEVHYVDHPMVGILVLITPYERPLDETLGATAEPLKPNGHQGSEQ